MSERTMDIALKSFLTDNLPYTYGHLIVFEKPIVGSDYETAGYSYFTDASVNITWDNGGGAKTYIANKLLKLGNINETTEAKTSNLSMTLASDTLGTIVPGVFSFTDGYTLVSNITGMDFVEEGFREGDVISIDFGTPVEATIAKFTNNNGTIHVLENVFGPYTSGSHTKTISIATPEIVAMYSNLNYVNRKVSVYKAYFNEQGEIVGDSPQTGPVLVFKGIIATGTLNDTLSSSTVTWTLTSHWGDFVRVQGRITSDSFHRALDASGNPDAGALLRDEYATDTGFSQAEKAISLIAIYNRAETRYGTSSSGGFLGIGRKTNIYSYEVNVPTELDLNFNLQAKYLPIVYGVRKVDSIPVFVDLDKNDTNTVYLAYAICEGEIAGIYDIYFNDSPLVCSDPIDESVREVSIAPDSVEVPCFGRADRGDILAGNYNTSAQDADLFIAPAYGPILSGTKQVVVEYRDGEGYESLTYYYSIVTNSETGEEIGRIMSYSGAEPNYVANMGRGPTGGHSPEAVQNAILKAEALLTYYRARYKPDTWDIIGRLEGFWAVSAESGVTGTSDVISENYGSEAEAKSALKGYVGGAQANTHGLIHNSYIEFDLPLATKIEAYTGKSFQTVSTLLNEVSNKQNFLMQSNYFDNTLTYWDTNHKLLDTAYVVAKFVIAEGETSLPSLDFVVKGKLLECFNYDGSYAAIDVANNSDGNNFNLLEVVNIYEITQSGTYPYSCIQGPLITTAKIIDKFLLNTADNALEWRFIFDTDLSMYPMYRMTGSGGLYTFGSVQVIPDQRVSTNPAIQLLDYLITKRYGKGLNLATDINMDTFITAAQQCDIRSDVTVKLAAIATPGQTITHSYNGVTLFSGTIVSSTYKAGFYETVITDCIGKLGRKWNDYTYFQYGELIWYKGEVRLAIANTQPVKYGDFFVGNGYSSELPEYTLASGHILKFGGSAAGNPVVKSYNPDEQTANTWNKSGYSLYDSDDVKYWKYLGWDSSDQRWVTRHQLNQVVRTDAPLFENVNNMLSQFNGMLRYSNGRYGLEIKSKSNDFPTSVHYIDNSDIIGTIKLTDNAAKETYNSLTASIIDPQNHFDSRAVSFFDSNYLKEDKNIPKQGRANLDGITNYYNARFNIKQQLDNSRFKKTIQFKMMPKGYLLLAGSVIFITYARYNWVDKEFRISTINTSSDSLIDIVAEEHSDSIYVVPNLNSEAAPPEFQYTRNIPTAPAGLVASTTQADTINLNWTLPSGFKGAIDTIEIYAAEEPNYGPAPNLSLATFVASTKARSISLPIDMTTIGTEILDYTIPASPVSFVPAQFKSTISKYYWIRVARTSVSTVGGNSIQVHSDFNDTAGVEGTAVSSDLGRNTISIVNSNELHILSANYLNVIDDYIGSGTEIYVYEVNKVLIYDDALETNGTFRVDVVPSDLNVDVTDDITPGALSWDIDHVVIADHSGLQSTLSKASIDYVITVKTNVGETLDPFTVTQDFQKIIDIPQWSINALPETYTYTTTRGFLLPADLADFTGFSFKLSRSGIEYTYAVSGTDTYSYGTITPTNVSYVVSGDGVLIIDGGSLATVATNVYGSLLVEIIDNNSGDVVANKLVTLNKLVIGVNWSVNGTNENHAFEADSGIISDFSVFSCTYSVLKNGVAQPYNIVGALESETWKFGTPISTQTSAVDDLDWTITGQSISIDATSPLGSDINIPSATLTIPILDNYDGSDIAIRTISIGKVGAGIDGIAGLNNATVYLYNKNTSSISAPTLFSGTFSYSFSTAILSGGTLNGWQQSAPSLVKGEYLWLSVATASSITMADSSILDGEFSTPSIVGIGGTDGADGDPGDQGIPGPSGTSSYFHIAYATNSTGTAGFSTSNAAGATYIGTYVDSILADSTNPALYAWSLIKGLDGDQGLPGTDGTDGTDGITSYLHIAYATNSTGTAGFHVSDSVNKTYLGQYIDNTLADSTNPASYAWSLIKGATGSTGTDGTDGLNSAIATLYRKNTSDSVAPNAFSGTFTYTFLTAVLSGGVLNSWTQNLPTLNPGEYIWARQASAVSISSTDNIAIGEWSAAVVIGGSGIGLAGVRGSGTFNFEEFTSGILSTNVPAWADTLTDLAAADVAEEVILAASDGYIRPNDKVTVTDNSANLAGTRIYTGSATQSAGSVTASNFSNLVVETFDGSVIVQGTLSADRLAADTVLTNDLKVASSITIGSGGSGNIHTSNKTSLGDSDAGFFLDHLGHFNFGKVGQSLYWDGTSLVIAGGAIHSAGKGSLASTAPGFYFSPAGQFNLGNGTNFLNWNGSALTLSGGLAVASGQTLSDIFPDATSLPANNADVTSSILSGSGVNIIPSRYSTFEGQNYTFPYKSATATPVIESGGIFGNNLLKIAASDYGAYTYLSSEGQAQKIPIDPAKKYIFSAYVKHSTIAQKSGNLYMYLQQDLAYLSVSFLTSITPNTWTRISGVINVSTGAPNSSSFAIRLDNKAGSGDMMFDGLMLEEYLGDGSNTEPSAFNEGAPEDTVKTFETGFTANSGGITLGTNATIKTSGKDSAYDSSSGFFLGTSGGVPTFAVGNSTKYIRWDGSSLTIRGSLNADDITAGTLNVDRISDFSVGNIKISNTAYLGGKKITVASLGTYIAIGSPLYAGDYINITHNLGRYVVPVIFQGSGRAEIWSVSYTEFTIRVTATTSQVAYSYV